MATSLILNGYTSITDAFRSSHYDRNAKSFCYVLADKKIDK